MPDERLGERACAYVVADGDLDFAELQRFLDSERVSIHYWPERLEFVTACRGTPRARCRSTCSASGSPARPTVPRTSDDEVQR
jgi:hypothetical protein